MEKIKSLVIRLYSVLSVFSAFLFFGLAIVGNASNAAIIQANSVSQTELGFSSFTGSASDLQIFATSTVDVPVTFQFGTGAFSINSTPEFPPSFIGLGENVEMDLSVYAETGNVGGSSGILSASLGLAATNFGVTTESIGLQFTTLLDIFASDDFRPASSFSSAAYELSIHLNDILAAPIITASDQIVVESQLGAGTLSDLAFSSNILDLQLAPGDTVFVRLSSSSVAGVVSPITEPATLVTISLGLIGLGCLRRKTSA